MTIAIENAHIITPKKPPYMGNIQIDDDRISYIGSSAVDRSDTVIDARSKYIIPGLINTHTHAAMTLLRSYGDDMPLQTWLEEKIWPLEAKLTSDDIYVGTQLAVVEMLRSGTTTINDMYFRPAVVARACSELGMRAFVSSSFFDFNDPSLLEKNLASVENDIKEVLSEFGDDPLIQPTIGPHAPYTVSLEGLRAAAEMAEKYDIKVQFHLAETEKEIRDFEKMHGVPLVRKLDEIGFLSPRVTAAHGVWLSREDMDILAARGVSISHNPISNMKLAVGSAFNYRQAREAGLLVTLGTDGAASNNNLNMLESMKFAAILAKHHWVQQTLMPAEEVFKMATVNGARALGIDAGELKEGALADIVIIDPKRPELTPGHNPIADLVYSFNGPVDTVIIGGRTVMEGGQIPGEYAIIDRAREAGLNLVERAIGD